MIGLLLFRYQIRLRLRCTWRDFYNICNLYRGDQTLFRILFFQRSFIFLFFLLLFLNLRLCFNLLFTLVFRRLYQKMILSILHLFWFFFRRRNYYIWHLAFRWWHLHLYFCKRRAISLRCMLLAFLWKSLFLIWFINYSVNYLIKCVNILDFLLDFLRYIFWVDFNSHRSFSDKRVNCFRMLIIRFHRRFSFFWFSNTHVQVAWFCIRCRLVKLLLFAHLIENIINY